MDHNISSEDLKFLEQLNKQPKLKARFANVLAIASTNDCPDFCTFDQAELKVVNNLGQLGQEVLQDCSENMHKKVVDKMRNEHPDYKVKEKKSLNWHCIYGIVTTSEYVWRKPGRSYYRPFAETIGLGSRACSFLLQRALTDFGSEKSFQKASWSVKEHYGFEVCPSTIRKITVKHAESMKKNRENRPKVRKVKGEGEPVIITQTDGSFLPIVKFKDGTGDRRKRRSMEWKEVRLVVAVPFKKVDASYEVSFEDVEETGELWSQAVKSVGWGSKTQIHVVGDGGPWIFLQSNRQFGRQGKFHLDFYHASEYLGEVGKVKLKESERIGWLRKNQELLKRNEFEKVLKNIKEHIDPENPDCKAFIACRYLDNRKDQLDYKTALEKELPIGSGLVESGHKHVLQSRMKLAGCAWDLEVARKMSQLLVLRENGEWEDYWLKSSLKLAA